MTGHDDQNVRRDVLARCRSALPGWAHLHVDDVEFDPPKGFSSFTMGVRPRPDVEPPAVLYRHLEGKENAILDPGVERDVFLLLGRHRIAAHCWYVDETCRIEAFHTGRTLTADDLRDHRVLQGIAEQLHRFHSLGPNDLPDGIPDATFFELLFAKWGPMAQSVLVDHRDRFPPGERPLADDLLRLGIGDDETLAAALALLPDRDPVFCHNDTYHGNVMALDDGSIKLLDFEFSCRNHAAFDFANLFAETVMVHGLADPPHFRIAEPSYTDADLLALIDAYLDCGTEPAQSAPSAERSDERDRLLAETRRAIPLSDLMYAFAALPLALEPIQRIRFLPYAHQRFTRFLAAVEGE